MTYYTFDVRGTYPSGTKARMTGHIEDADDYPSSAFDKAVKVCQEMTPGLIVDMSKPGNVSLRRLKRKPR